MTSPALNLYACTRMPLRVSLLAVIAAASVLSLDGCKKEVKPAAAETQTDPFAVKVPPALTGSLKIGPPRLTDVRGTLQVSGRVETDASRIARVGSPVAGRILKLNAFEGEYVHAGTVLATLHSTNLSDTQMSLIKAYSDQTLAEAATKRAEQLVEADVIGRAELERRRAELVQASAEVSSYETQLRGLGMTNSQMKVLQSTRRLSADYPIVTPRAGTVLERKVTVGQVVQPADPAYTIADLSSVWVVANVPEEEAGMLRKGLEVSVRIPARPEQDIHGALAYVAPTVDPATRTVEVRMDLRNNQGLFKPDELASVTFGGHTEKKLTVPQTAIVREENKDYIFVQTAVNRFLLREVQLGDESNDERVVLSGVTANELIVLDGAFHLNNQRKQDAIKGSR
ncbi:efflux RND transporter periplasmic adaptor subunit [Terriglobus roseus]|uniref:Membrane fusion protein, cobalt-zinc-cadmium efflux system n=1 Tax=Terriglobus roseus TaxID=392734 RepID=A0A1H4J6N3_9BACT|nr:efflux RND transporter periplasmic adaptor subunit [Terriglobus roseus]SEB41974.1 membrane fusion protein, cobalt-zinc-cadmium efflux system [Terriglobus roseus]